MKVPMIYNENHTIYYRDRNRKTIQRFRHGNRDKYHDIYLTFYKCNRPKNETHKRFNSHEELYSRNEHSEKACNYRKVITRLLSMPKMCKLLGLKQYLKTNLVRVYEEFERELLLC